MPFCMANVVKFLKKIIISLSEIVTLQVRIPKENLTNIFCDCRYRKVFLSAFHSSGKASMTIEAALTLSIFIFAAVLLLLPMKILNTQRKIQAELEAAGEEFSQYAYVQHVFLTGQEELAAGMDEFAKRFGYELIEGAAERYVQIRAEEQADTHCIEHVTLKRSEILNDGEMIDLIMDYEIRMPFPVLGIHVIPCTARSCRRAWIGKEGKETKGDPDGKEAEVVYVGKNSTRYHKNRNCHYLANRLSAVAFEEISEKRNGSGRKYGACAVCGKQAVAGSMVYIMPEGSSYHSTKICTAILSYVRAVKLSEAEHLGACSYCSQ